ncbi:hypothetical protein [Candidatus Symbiopectobacterium sp. NZEC135]|uniref:hypothetical protein n=1 Tax=Candidatus Symbiopectobacterium sp. NZEC135 TaxID=2820471 RepID=UPI00222756B2|nr:hypothetical protein [Candidatus Symbiopectobacterium sp. NZEC135]MCW2478208.1 hypothetical protein [Candidatus Symbiopectobacterium sp. NZEC135]
MVSVNTLNSSVIKERIESKSHKSPPKTKWIEQEQDNSNLSPPHITPSLYERINTLKALHEVKKSKKTQQTDTPYIMVNNQDKLIEKRSEIDGEVKINLEKMPTFKHLDSQENEKLLDYFFPKNNINTPNIKKEKLISAVANYMYTDPTDDMSINTNRIIALATNVFSPIINSKQNGGLRFQEAESMLYQWFSQSIFEEKSPIEYCVSEIAKRNSDIDTIGKLHAYLLNKKNSLFSTPLFSDSDRKNIDRIWNDTLFKEMPFLKKTDSEIEKMKLKDYNFISLYTGSLFLDKIGLETYTSQEAIMAGELLWDTVEDSEQLDKINFFQSPAKIFMATHASKWFDENKKEKNIGDFCIQEHKKYRDGIKSISQDISRIYNNYSTAVSNWLSKGKLADKIIRQCPKNELSEFYKKETVQSTYKELYLNGFTKPCDSAPENLDDEYQKLTNDIADNFYEIDRYLISSALNSLPYEEREFISSIKSTISHVDFNMRTVRPFVGGFFQGLTHNENINLKNTMLLGIINDKEERIYALHDKKDGHIEGYDMIRVDRDIKKYIEKNLLEKNNISEDYIIKENLIESKLEDVRYEIKINNDKVISKKFRPTDLVDYISKIHRDDYYNYLYAAGDDKSDLQKKWEFLKMFIPFYQCAEGINKNAPEEYIPDCLIDALSFIPTFRMAANLGKNFSTSAILTFLSVKKLSFKEVFQKSSKTILNRIPTPTAKEIKTIGKTILKDADPGFILLGKLSNRLSNKLSSSVTTPDFIKKHIGKLSTNGSSTPLSINKNTVAKSNKATKTNSSYIPNPCVGASGRAKRQPCQLDNEMNANSIFEQSGFSQPLYRADRKSYEELKITNGFTPSEDFGAVSNMLKDTETLIVAEDLTGLLRYIRANRASYHIYKIDGSTVRGASLVTNIEKNPVGLAKFLEATSDADNTIDWLYETQGANKLYEAHVKLSDVTLDKITYLGKGSSKELSDKIDSLEPGDWQDYL